MKVKIEQESIGHCTSEHEVKADVMLGTTSHSETYRPNCVISGSDGKHINRGLVSVSGTAFLAAFVGVRVAEQAHILLLV